jgi:hypothetical protein
MPYKKVQRQYCFYLCPNFSHENRFCITFKRRILSLRHVYIFKISMKIQFLTGTQYDLFQEEKFLIEGPFTYSVFAHKY